MRFMAIAPTFLAYTLLLSACSDTASSGTPGRSGGERGGTSGSSTSSGSSSGATSSGSSAGSTGSSSGSASSSGGSGSGDDAGGDAADATGGDPADASGSSSGSSSGSGSSDGGSNPYNDPNLVPIFDGVTLNGWTQVPANSWSVVGGAMHSLGTARGFIHTTNTGYGSFRWIFTERLVPPVSHQACTLEWGNQLKGDALAAIQMQVPNGAMWDYRRTGLTANKDPVQFETHFANPNLNAQKWSQCEILADNNVGSLRLACCQLPGTTPCRAVKITDFKDPAAVGLKGPVALQIHNGGMIEEFKDLYIESPVVTSPGMLITTQ